MVRHGAGVHAFSFRDAAGRARYWRDIGTLDSYYVARMDPVEARGTAAPSSRPEVGMEQRTGAAIRERGS